MIVLSLLASNAIAGEYSGCEDPDYKAYVTNRLEYYDQLEKERYEGDLVYFDQLDISEKHRFLYSNTVLSAKFDSEEVALKNISRFEDLGGSDSSSHNFRVALHKVNIAKGWIALRSGDIEEATRYLLKSTETKGTAALSTFGPDKTLIRALYQKGHKTPVLDYLDKVQSFWHTDSALEYVEVWRTMIANDCSIQFQFYDKTSIVALGL